MSKVGAWFAETRRTYLDNATSQRDFRVQMRGFRSALLFGVYLLVLIGVAMTVYSTALMASNSSISDAQNRLQEFYTVIIGLLGGVVSLVAPALTATTIVIERQRHSFDLIFSAPVKPRYYLVGKLLASFRYTWMLLVLSLPVTAACVVLGGATWSDVMVTYLTLSMHGLIFTSFALLMSTLAPKPVSAVTWSYGAVIFYLILSGSASAMLTSISMGRATQEAPFLAVLNPFLLSFSIHTHTTILGVPVPNWIFIVGTALVVSQICLLAAGSFLSPIPKKEVRALRLHSFVWLPIFSGYAAYSGSPNLEPAAAVMLCTLLLVLDIPFLTTYGRDVERSYRLNGTFKFRHTLDGTAAGSLPYLASLVILCLAGAFAGALWAGSRSLFSLNSLVMTAYALSFWFMTWSLGRFVSGYTATLKAARASVFALLMVLLIGPLPLFAILEQNGIDINGESAFRLHVLSPVFSSVSTGQTTLAVVYTVLLLGMSGGLTMAGERAIARRLTPAELENDRVLATS